MKIKQQIADTALQQCSSVKSAKKCMIKIYICACRIRKWSMKTLIYIYMMQYIVIGLVITTAMIKPTSVSILSPEFFQWS